MSANPRELLATLDKQIAAAHETAAMLRQAMPVDAKFEASNIVAGLADPLPPSLLVGIL